jgi:large subunit ribosomal protein L19
MSEEIQKTEGAEAAPVEEAKAEAKPAVQAVRIKNTLASVEKDLLAQQNNSDKFPAFEPGDTVKVHVRIVEGDKSRIQPFEGTVLAVKHGGNRKTFMVRRVSFGVAIERVFPIHSPFIDKLEVIRKGKVRRAKLYYMRGRFGRSAVVTEKV